jgi:hypothetical protein
MRAGEHGVGGAREHEWAMGETDWAAAPEYDEPDGERTIPAFLVGALAGMVALGLVWAMTVFLDGAATDGRRAATSAETSVATSPEPTTATTEPSPGREAVAAPPSSPQTPCEQADAALTAPLRAAGPALDQWEVHVGAMNKLMVGAITPEQAGAFWSESKVGAVRNLKRFDDANRGVGAAAADCPPPDAVVQDSGERRSCARHVARERQALEAAGTALQTWKTHIRHMRMLDMGHLAPDEASRLWLANWQRGIEEIRDYRAARRVAADSGGC